LEINKPLEYFCGKNILVYSTTSVGFTSRIQFKLRKTDLKDFLETKPQVEWCELDEKIIGNDNGVNAEG
jgi:hypothetical protein